MRCFTINLKKNYTIEWIKCGAAMRQIEIKRGMRLLIGGQRDDRNS